MAMPRSLRDSWSIWTDAATHALRCRSTCTRSNCFFNGLHGIAERYGRSTKRWFGALPAAVAVVAGTVQVLTRMRPFVIFFASSGPLGLSWLAPQPARLPSNAFSPIIDPTWTRPVAWLNQRRKIDCATHATSCSSCSDRVGSVGAALAPDTFSRSSPSTVKPADLLPQERPPFHCGACCAGFSPTGRLLRRS